MYQQVKDEPFLHLEEQEEKIYQEQLEQRKQANIFAQVSSSEFLKLLPLKILFKWEGVYGFRFLGRNSRENWVYP